MSNKVETPPSSSKIPKNIKSIIFSGKKTKRTFITVQENYLPNGENEVIEDNPTYRSTRSRHPDFTRAMDRFKVHIMVRAGFAQPFDRFDKKVIDAQYFADHLFESDDRFSNVEITGIIVTTRKETTGFQILGTYFTEDGEMIKLKSPVISTLKKAEGEGYNYALLVLAEEHLDTLMLEAQEYLKGKSANNQLKIAI
jgi:hypothetical protein